MSLPTEVSPCRQKVLFPSLEEGEVWCWSTWNLRLAQILSEGLQCQRPDQTSNTKGVLQTTTDVAISGHDHTHSTPSCQHTGPAVTYIQQIVVPLFSVVTQFPHLSWKPSSRMHCFLNNTLSKQKYHWCILGVGIDWDTQSPTRPKWGWASQSWGLLVAHPSLAHLKAFEWKQVDTNYCRHGWGMMWPGSLRRGIKWNLHYLVTSR